MVPRNKADVALHVARASSIEVGRLATTELLTVVSPIVIFLLCSWTLRIRLSYRIFNRGTARMARFLTWESCRGERHD